MLGSYVRLWSFGVMLEGGSDSSQVQGAYVAVAFVIPFWSSSPEKRIIADILYGNMYLKMESD